VTRSISPTQRCVSGNVYRQTSPAIPEVTCKRRIIMGFLHRRLWYGLSAWGWNYG